MIFKCSDVYVCHATEIADFIKCVRIDMFIDVFRHKSKEIGKECKDIFIFEKHSEIVNLIFIKLHHGILDHIGVEKNVNLLANLLVVARELIACTYFQILTNVFKIIISTIMLIELTFQKFAKLLYFLL